MQDIKPLLAFAATVKYSSMQAAARTLNMTPSAISQHIARLEKTHHVRLFNRASRRLTLTDAGEALSASCHRLLAVLDDIHIALDNVQTEIAGEVRIAAPSALAPAITFQRALQRISHDYPALHLRLYFNEALEDLREGKFDIALRGGEHALDRPDLVARPLAQWAWMICAAPAYLAKAAPIEHPEDLIAQRWLRHLPLQLEMRREDKRFFLDIQESIYCNQLSAVRWLCEAGLGLALLSEGEVKDALQKKTLQQVLPQWSLPSFPIYAVTPYRLQTAKVRAVMQVFQDVFKHSN